MNPVDRFQPLLPAIEAAHTVLICSHAAPEGDCLGASLGLCLALEQLGKTVRLFNPDPVPRQCQFLDGWERFERQLPEGTFDVVFVVDCGDLSRTGPQHVGIPARGPVINIDHHGSNTHFGGLNVVDAAASSTCELIYGLLLALQIRFTRPMAEALLAGIMIDTGSFRYQNTSAWTLDVARALVGFGADPARVATGLFESMSPARLLLLPRVLDTLQFAAHGQIAAIYVSQAMLDRAGALLSDTEGFINYPRAVDGVEIAVFYKETGSELSVSMRSKQHADIGAVARKLGGGGHRLAAAFATSEPLADVQARLMPLLELALADVSQPNSPAAGSRTQTLPGKP